MAEPRYVQACRAGSWHLKLWPKETGKAVLIPYCCCSWRHEGHCRHAKGALDFCRIRDAIKTRKDWTYLVLTFDPAFWPSAWQQCKQGVVLWSRLRKRLTREFGPIQYVQTWECHKSGLMHVNVLVGNKKLHALCSNGGWREFRQRWLKPAAVEVGFGFVCWVEPMRKKGGMAGYLVKLARELTGGGKDYQIPVDSPRHFRRLRASRGLLPPVETTGEWSGFLVSGPIPFDPITGELLK